jgi:hypothetical protein
LDGSEGSSIRDEDEIVQANGKLSPRRGNAESQKEHLKMPKLKFKEAGILPKERVSVDCGQVAPLNP